MKRVLALRAGVLLVFILAANACTPVALKNPPSPNNPPSQTTPVVVRILDLSGMPAAPTSSIPPTWTPMPTRAASATPTSKTALTTQGAPTTQRAINPTTPACKNQATLVKHLTLSDNTVIKTGVRIAKSWRIQNSGTCAWTTGYHLIMVGGDNLLVDPAPLVLPQAAKPGDTLDLSVLIMAPDTPGNYSSAWMLQDEAGNLFGGGDAADQPIAMTISVQSSIKNLPT